MCYSVSQCVPGALDKQLSSYGGPGKREGQGWGVTSDTDLFLLFGSSPRSLKARAFASVLGTVTCVERLYFFLLLRPKKGTWGILPGVTWILRQPVCLLSASPYLQAMFCFCPKLPKALQGWGAASGGLGWAEKLRVSHQHSFIGEEIEDLRSGACWSHRPLSKTELVGMSESSQAVRWREKPYPGPWRPPSQAVPPPRAALLPDPALVLQQRCIQQSVPLQSFLRTDEPWKHDPSQ